MTNATIGPVSTGTEAPADLIPVLSELLAKLAPGEFGDLQAEAKACMAALKTGDEDQFGDIDPDGVVDELLHELHDLAPPYCYFGSKPGELLTYGFWISEFAINQASREKELLKVSDLAEIPPGWARDVLVINDQGNMSLYQPKITFENVWAVV